MFHLRRAALRAASSISITPASRVVSIRAVKPTSSITSSVRAFTQFQPRWASEQEQAATSESTDAIQSSQQGDASPAKPVADGQEAAATSETTDQVATNNDVEHSIYVGNLPFQVEDKQLEDHFKNSDGVISVRLARQPDGTSRGFGFVKFESAEAASAAAQAFDMSFFEGRTMRARVAEGSARSRTIRPEQPPTNSLYIGNLSFDMTDKELNDLFREVKNVTDVRVAIDRRTGQPRGFAHADFTDVDSASAAKQSLQTVSVHGRTLKVDFARSSRDR